MKSNRTLSGVGGLFAVRVVRTKTGVAGGQYEAKDIADERISVYRTRDKKCVLSLFTATFPEARPSFAISLDGRQLALLTLAGVRLYTLADPVE